MWSPAAQFVDVMGFVFPVRAPCCAVLTCSLLCKTYLALKLLVGTVANSLQIYHQFFFLIHLFQNKSGIVSNASFINFKTVVIIVHYSLKS